MSNGTRWRWHLLALIPGVLSNLIFIGLLLLSMNARNNADWVGAIARPTLWVGLCLPLATPFYAYFVGRGYVRAFDGLKSAIPFAILYSAANLALWLSGIILIVANLNNFR
jgi:hypothetical protein